MDVGHDYSQPPGSTVLPPACIHKGQSLKVKIFHANSRIQPPLPLE